MANNYEQKPFETAEAYYKRLAKVADQRLVRLEKLSTEKGFKSVKDWAYATAQKDIRKYTPDGTRFNVKVNVKDIPDRITDIKRFLEKPSSNKRDIVKFYKKRAASLNKSQSTNFTWEQLADFFENKKNEKNIKVYGSGDTLRVQNSINQGNVVIGDSVEGETQKQRRERQKRELAQALKENNLDNIIHVDDENVKETIIEMLQANNLKIKDLIK